MADELVDAGPVASAELLDPRLAVVTCACGGVFGIAPRSVDTGLPSILRAHRRVCSRAPVSTADALRGFADWVEAGGFTTLTADRRRARVELLRAAVERLDELELARLTSAAAAGTLRAAQAAERAARHDEPQAMPGAPPAAAERLVTAASVQGRARGGKLDAERRWTVAEGAALQLLYTHDPDGPMLLGQPPQFADLAARLVAVVRRTVEQ